MSDSEAQIWKLFEKLEDMERKLTAVTEQRDEALSDLAFSRDLYRLQTKTLDDVCEQRDRLAEALNRIANNNVQDLPETNYAYEFGRIEGIAKIALQSLTTNAQAMASAYTKTPPKETTL